MWDLGFDCSWEAAFAEIGHRMQDIDMKRKWDMGFLQKGSGNVRSGPPFQTLNLGFLTIICKLFMYIS